MDQGEGEAAADPSAPTLVVGSSGTPSPSPARPAGFRTAAHALSARRSPSDGYLAPLRGISGSSPTALSLEGIQQPDYLPPSRRRGAPDRVAGRRQRDDTDQPKYINPPSSSRFQKNEWLYGLYQAKEAIRQKGFVYVVEGYKDLLAMHASGAINSVAIGGTSLCDGQLRLLQAHTREVCLMLDGDEAGKKGMERAAAMIRRAGMLCHLFRLPKGEDPDSMFRLMGPIDWATWLRCYWEEMFPDIGERLAYRIQKGILLLANEHDPERRQYLLGLLQQRWRSSIVN